MGFVDRIIKGEELSYEGAFDLQDFLDNMKTLIEEHDYKLAEKQYIGSGPKEKRNFKVKWELTKKPDDYHEIKIVLKIKAKGIESGKGSKKLRDGKLIMEIEAEVERDTQSKWDSAWKAFFRQVYDKYIQSDKTSKVAGMVRRDADSLKQEFKTYFNL